MFIEGLSDTEKRQLAVTLRERGHIAFMAIKHAVAAMLSQKRGGPINEVDQAYLRLVDNTIEELFGYQRQTGELYYMAPEQTAATGTGFK
ncbi:hypothetical protein [Reinekea thalattae]|uniref:Uncharacterized protein n=1 Tax=Reinekea thalattae TaxID=2593301 RepID=A0A5C8ZAF4_9GAMM|nr:hypothetical protein [Reinekea thalattae]TXR54269.1 hypothetical protein FME95_06960 [Reinekea thalattae]